MLRQNKPIQLNSWSLDPNDLSCMTPKMIKFITPFLILLSGCKTLEISSSNKLGQESQASVDDAKYFNSLLAGAVPLSKLEKKDQSGLNLFSQKNPKTIHWIL